MGIGTVFVVGSLVKIASVCCIGLGTTSFIKFFHDYELKFKKKGDYNATNQGESLREKAQKLS
ncbi:hypothetical protein LCM23_06305 [Cytobacillus kochii]|uniref:DUF7394 family protein n=1 Tax=Cytobacillus kochii TaxID=859143 RepID=UPI001CD6E545|nr:hypothetical protein [Cytobacillus kochii]MCA1025697.1 hypothetical protein [Cytobacillus kochii]